MTNPLEDFPLFVKRWLPALLWMGLILFASTDAGSASNSSHPLKLLLRWINPQIKEPAIDEINIILRKAMHVMQFSILAILVWRAHRMLKLPQKNRTVRTVTLVFFLAIVFAVGSEFVQHLMKDRGASVQDIFLDLTGTALGLFVIYLAGLCKKHPPAKPTPG